MKWFSGAANLPCTAPPGISIVSSNLFNHINDIFDAYRKPDFTFDVEQVYGDHKLLNKYLENLQAKEIEPIFAKPVEMTHMALFLFYG